MRIALQEVPFEDGPSQHSRFVSGIVQVNERKPDYKMLGSQEVKLAYATLMIGKETVAYNDKSKAVNDFLEKLLSFMFQVKRKTRL
ncbi:MAG: hypothetical protein KAV98_01005 [Dehalococcoidia bacterium]|nr:hypothetical protein [Dehalococcoidia bacterium]